MADWNGFKKNGTPYIPNDATARAGVIANTKLIKDTVGFSGKNKCPRFSNYSQANVVFTVDSDGVVDITTSAAASANVWNVIDSGLPVLENGKKYKVSGFGTSANQDGYIVGDNNGADYVYVHDEGNGGEFTYDSSKPLKKIQIGLRSGQTASHTKLSPMIYDADILDDTYEPYFGSTAFPRSEQAVLGAKNLLENKAITQTVNGITLTVNEDKSFTVNGTESSGNNADFDINSTLYLEEGTKLILSAEGIGNNDSTRLFLYYVADYTKLNVYVSADHDAGIITIPLSGIYRVYFRVLGSKTVTNMTIKPMLRLASDTDDTYVPHAMTNRELTELKEYEITTSLTLNSDGINKAVRNIYNAFVSYKFVDVTLASYGVLGNLPKELRPSKAIICPFIVGGNVKRCIINADGNITSPEAISNTWVELNLSYMVI